MSTDDNKDVPDGTPKWRVVTAGKNNHNPLIEDVLKPLRSELLAFLKSEILDFDKKVRRK